MTYKNPNYPNYIGGGSSGSSFNNGYPYAPSAPGYPIGPTAPSAPTFMPMPTAPQGDFYSIQKRRKALAYQGDNSVNPYRDPFAINSMSDVLFNSAAKKKKYGEKYTSWLGQTTAALSDHFKENYIDAYKKGGWEQVGVNAIASIGEDLSVLDNPIKGMIKESGMSNGTLGASMGLGGVVGGAIAAAILASNPAGWIASAGMILTGTLTGAGLTSAGASLAIDAEKAMLGFERGLGTGSEGRYNYDIATGSAIGDFATNLALDPGIWLTFGMSAGARAASTTLKGLVSEGVEGGAKGGAKAFAKMPFADLWKAKESIADYMYLGARAVNVVDDAIVKAAWSTNPIGWSVKGFKYGFSSTKQGIQTIMKHIDPPKAVVESAEDIIKSKYQNNYFDNLAKQQESSSILNPMEMQDVVKTYQSMVNDTELIVKMDNAYEGIFSKSIESDVFDLSTLRNYAEERLAFYQKEYPGSKDIVESFLYNDIETLVKTGFAEGFDGADDQLYAVMNALRDAPEDAIKQFVGEITSVSKTVFAIADKVKSDVAVLRSSVIRNVGGKMDTKLSILEKMESTLKSLMRLDSKADFSVILKSMVGNEVGLLSYYRPIVDEIETLLAAYDISMSDFMRYTTRDVTALDELGQSVVRYIGKDGAVVMPKASKDILPEKLVTEYELSKKSMFQQKVDYDALVSDADITNKNGVALLDREGVNQRLVRDFFGKKAGGDSLQAPRALEVLQNTRKKLEESFKTLQSFNSEGVPTHLQESFKDTLSKMDKYSKAIEDRMKYASSIEEMDNLLRGLDVEGLTSTLFIKDDNPYASLGILDRYVKRLTPSSFPKTTTEVAGKAAQPATVKVVRNTYDGRMLVKHGTIEDKIRFLDNAARYKEVRLNTGVKVPKDFFERVDVQEALTLNNNDKYEVVRQFLGEEFFRGKGFENQSRHDLFTDLLVREEMYKLYNGFNTGALKAGNHGLSQEIVDTIDDYFYDQVRRHNSYYDRAADALAKGTPLDKMYGYLSKAYTMGKIESRRFTDLTQEELDKLFQDLFARPEPKTKLGKNLYNKIREITATMGSDADANASGRFSSVFTENLADHTGTPIFSARDLTDNLHLEGFQRLISTLRDTKALAETMKLEEQAAYIAGHEAAQAIEKIADELVRLKENRAILADVDFSGLGPSMTAAKEVLPSTAVDGLKFTDEYARNVYRVQMNKIDQYNILALNAVEEHAEITLGLKDPASSMYKLDQAIRGLDAVEGFHLLQKQWMRTTDVLKGAYEYVDATQRIKAILDVDPYTPQILRALEGNNMELDLDDALANTFRQVTDLFTRLSNFKGKGPASLDAIVKSFDIPYSPINNIFDSYVSREILTRQQMEKIKDVFREYAMNMSETNATKFVNLPGANFNQEIEVLKQSLEVFFTELEEYNKHLSIIGELDSLGKDAVEIASHIRGYNDRLADEYLYLSRNSKNKDAIIARNAKSRRYGFSNMTNDNAMTDAIETEAERIAKHKKAIDYHARMAKQEGILQIEYEVRGVRKGANGTQYPYKYKRAMNFTDYGDSLDAFLYGPESGRTDALAKMGVFKSSKDADKIAAKFKANIKTFITGNNDLQTAYTKLIMQDVASGKAFDTVLKERLLDTKTFNHLINTNKRLSDAIYEAGSQLFANDQEQLKRFVRQFRMGELDAGRLTQGVDETFITNSVRRILTGDRNEYSDLVEQVLKTELFDAEFAIKESIKSNKVLAEAGGLAGDFSSGTGEGRTLKQSVMERSKELLVEEYEIQSRTDLDIVLSEINEMSHSQLLDQLERDSNVEIQSLANFATSKQAKDALYMEQATQRRLKRSVARFAESIPDGTPDGADAMLYGKSNYETLASNFSNALKTLTGTEIAQLIKHNTTSNFLIIESAVFGKDLSEQIVKELAYFGYAVKRSDRYVSITQVTKNGAWEALEQLQKRVGFIRSDLSGGETLRAANILSEEVGAEIGHTPVMDASIFTPVRFEAERAMEFIKNDPELFELLGEENLTQYAHDLVRDRGYTASFIGSSGLYEGLVGSTLDNSFLPKDPIKNHFNAAVISSYRNNDKHKFMSLLLNDKNRLGNLVTESGLDNNQVLELFKQHSDLRVAYYSEKGKVRTIKINTMKDLQDAIATNGVLTFDSVARQMNKMISPVNLKELPGGIVLEFLQKYVNPIYNVFPLINPAAWVRNTYDGVIKNYIVNPDTANVKNMMIYLEELKEFYKMDRELLGEFNVKTLKEYAEKKFPYDMLKQKEFLVSAQAFIEYDKTIAASSVLTSQMNKKVADAISSGQIDDATFVQKAMFNNPISRIGLSGFGAPEVFNRYNLYKAERGFGGKSFSESLQSVLDTHFDYTGRNTAETVLNVLMPFSSFPIYNALFWAEQMLTNKHIMKAFLVTREEDYLGVDWIAKKIADPEDPSGDYYRQQLLSGNAMTRRGDYSYLHKMNPSMFDSFSFLPNLISNPLERLSAPIADAVKLAKGEITSWDELNYPAKSNINRVKNFLVRDFPRAVEGASQGDYGYTPGLANGLINVTKFKGFEDTVKNFIPRYKTYGTNGRPRMYFPTGYRRAYPKIKPNYGDSVTAYRIKGGSTLSTGRVTKSGRFIGSNGISYGNPALNNFYNTDMHIRLGKYGLYLANAPVGVRLRNPNKGRTLYEKMYSKKGKSRMANRMRQFNDPRGLYFTLQDMKYNIF